MDNSCQEFISPAKLHWAFELMFMYTATVLKLYPCQKMYTLLLFILIGVTLRLRGNSITTDGCGRIVITDINPDGDNDEDARSHLSV